MTNDEGISAPPLGEDLSEEAFWSWGDSAVVREGTPRQVHNLEERTARFGEGIIGFAKKVPQGPTTNRIISQLVGAATSVGANYVEADDSVSKKEFLKCIGTCKKEARETKHFLRMVFCAVPELKARELHLIFAKIWRSGKAG